MPFFTFFMPNLVRVFVGVQTDLDLDDKLLDGLSGVESSHVFYTRLNGRRKKDGWRLIKNLFAQKSVSSLKLQYLDVSEDFWRTFQFKRGVYSWIRWLSVPRRYVALTYVFNVVLVQYITVVIGMCNISSNLIDGFWTMMWKRKDYCV